MYMYNDHSGIMPQIKRHVNTATAAFDKLPLKLLARNVSAQLPSSRRWSQGKILPLRPDRGQSPSVSVAMIFTLPALLSKES